MNGTWKIISDEEFFDGEVVTKADGKVVGYIDETGFRGGFVGSFRLTLAKGVDLIIPSGQFYSVIDFDKSTIKLVAAN